MLRHPFLQVCGSAASVVPPSPSVTRPDVPGRRESGESRIHRRMLLTSVDDPTADAAALDKRRAISAELVRQAEAVLRPGADSASDRDKLAFFSDPANPDPHLSMDAMRGYASIGGLVPRDVARALEKESSDRMTDAPSSGAAKVSPTSASILDACDVFKFPPGSLTAASTLPLVHLPPWTDSDKIARVLITPLSSSTQPSKQRLSRSPVQCAACVVHSLALVVIQPWTICFSVLCIFLEHHNYLTHVSVCTTHVRKRLPATPARPPLRLQLLTIRERAFPLPAHSDPWGSALEVSVFWSLFLTTLVVARAPFGALGTSWSSSSVNPSEFILGVFGLSIGMYLFRGLAVAAVRAVGVGGFCGSCFAGTALFARIRAYFAAVEGEVFDKASRMQRSEKQRAGHASLGGSVLEDAGFAASRIAGPPLQQPASLRVAAGK